MKCDSLRDNCFVQRLKQCVTWRKQQRMCKLRQNMHVQKKKKKNQQVCIWIQYKDAAYANLQMLER